MTAPSDAWVPVPLPVRHLCAGDVFYSPKTGDLWMVAHRVDLADRSAAALTVRRGDAEHTAELDLDTVLQVLVSVAERDANEVCRQILGGALADRART